MAAVVLMLMPAKGSCPAHLDGTYDAQMTARHEVRFFVLLAMLSKDIRQFDAVRRPHQRFGSGLQLLIEGTGNLRQVYPADVEINRGS